MTLFSSYVFDARQSLKHYFKQLYIKIGHCSHADILFMSMHLTSNMLSRKSEMCAHGPKNEYRLVTDVGRFNNYGHIVRNLSRVNSIIQKR